MKAMRVLAPILFAVLVSLYAGLAWATQVLPVSVPGLLKAELAFRGTCTGAETYILYHPKISGGLLVTTYTFSVPADGVIKGDVSETISFTQLGASIKDSRKFNAPYVVGMPHYEVGKEYTVFLTGQSVLGLRSTIGLGMGRFNVITDPGGKRMVVNDYDNRGLFQGIGDRPAVTKALKAAGVPRERVVVGPIPEQDFTDIVRSLQPGK